MRSGISKGFNNLAANVSIDLPMIFIALDNLTDLSIIAYLKALISESCHDIERAIICPEPSGTSAWLLLNMTLSPRASKSIRIR